MEENRKSSVETEMENYLKSELGGAAETAPAVPDIVQNLVITNKNEGSNEENLVTSAIISVDDMDSGDFNNEEKESGDKKDEHRSL